MIHLIRSLGFPGGSDSKECNAGDLGSVPGLERFPWRRTWQPTPVFLLRESHGPRSLAGYREHLSTHTMYTQRSIGGGSALIPDPFGGQVPKTRGIDPPWRRERRRFSFR